MSFEQSAQIWERLAHRQPSVTEYQSNLATIYVNIGILLQMTGRPAESLASFV